MVLTSIFSGYEIGENAEFKCGGPEKIPYQIEFIPQDKKHEKIIGTIQTINLNKKIEKDKDITYTGVSDDEGIRFKSYCVGVTLLVG